MKKEEFDKKAKAASKEFASKKKVASQPETQFFKGALWAWDILTQGHTVAEYEEILRQDVCDRFGIDKPERWQESLIQETAKKMARLDRQDAQVANEGDTLIEYDKNLNEHTINHPLQITMKELERTIGMQREHLGLSAKATKKREDTKKVGGKQDRLQSTLEKLSGKL